MRIARIELASLSEVSQSGGPNAGSGTCGINNAMPSDAHTPQVLIADDQPDVLEALRFVLKSDGYRSEAANSPAAVLDAVESRDFDVVLMDLNYTRDTTSGQ